jgi:hypothetical protein
MPVKRAHILLPDDLLREIDSLVGPRGRSAFLVETARSEVRRQKLLRYLEGKGQGEKQRAWKEENHPELVEGAGEWVRKLRAQSEDRGAPRRPGKRSRNH